MIDKEKSGADLRRLWWRLQSKRLWASRKPGAVERAMGYDVLIRRSAGA